MNTRHPTFENVIRAGGWLVLDTETTGLHLGSEIVQLAIVNEHGLPLLDTLIRPVRPIPPDATRIHGLTNAMVAAAPTWGVLVPKIHEMLKDRVVITYNAEFDQTMFYSAGLVAGIDAVPWKTLASWWCAMKWYASVAGARSHSYRAYRWQSLGSAMVQEGLPVSKAHNALGDAQMTVRLIRAMVLGERVSAADQPKRPEM